jgi:pimeloyl-ACP methyl ester carboxylesterase
VKVEVGDTRLFFDVDGAGLVPQGPSMHERPTVVLLHTGPGADHSLYKDHVGPVLADVAQVVYLDVRGAGRSDFSSRERWNLETWSADVPAFCSAVEIERPILLGTAFGAYVALLVAARHPELVSKLVLVSAVARYSHTRSITLFDRLGGPEAGEIAARYFANPGSETFPDFLRVCIPLYTRKRLPAETVARTEINIELGAHWEAGEGRTFDLRQDASRVRCPTLLLAGADDPSTTLAGARELVAAMPPGLVRFEHYANTGHGVFRDAPHAMETVREFVLAPVEEDEER